MVEIDPRQQFQRVINTLLRHRKLIAGFLLAGMAGGLLYYTVTPKVYQASAMLIYQRQQVNPTKMSPDLVEQTKQIVSTVSQQITSTTSLEKMIKEFDLYPELRQSLPMEDVVIEMRDKDIRISSAEKGDIFQVSYMGDDPKKVMRVTNAIAAQFIEENLKYREERVTATAEYIQNELKMAKTALDKKEEVMRDYKLKYYNEMPQQLEVNMSRLNALQEQYQNGSNSLQTLEQTRLLVQEQLSRSRENQRLSSAELTRSLPGTADVNPAPGLNKNSELNQLYAALDSLLAKYTEQHPDIRRLKRQIAQLEEDLARSPAAPASEDKTAPAKPLPARPADPQLAKLETQLHEIELNLRRFRQDRDETTNQIRQYQAWISMAPVREAEWSALTRDYEELKKHYETLMSRSLEATSAENLERLQKGSQFKIVDPARFPEKPFKPDFMKIMAVALLLGAGLGGGIALALEFLNTSFRDATDLETYLGIPVVCSIPLIETSHEKRKKMIMTVVWSGAFAFSVCSIAAWIVYLWKKGALII